MTDAPAGEGPGVREPLAGQSGAGDTARAADDDSTDGQDDEVDEASAESFPASDAPEGWSGPPGT